MGWVDGAVHGRKQFVTNDVEVDGVSQPQREGRDDRLGVVAGTVEAPIKRTSPSYGGVRMSDQPGSIRQ
jgi:hypothetical protein